MTLWTGHESNDHGEDEDVNVDDDDIDVDEDEDDDVHDDLHLLNHSSDNGDIASTPLLL